MRLGRNHGALPSRDMTQQPSQLDQQAEEVDQPQGQHVAATQQVMNDQQTSSSQQQTAAQAAQNQQQMHQQAGYAAQQHQVAPQSWVDLMRPVQNHLYQFINRTCTDLVNFLTAYLPSSHINPAMIDQMFAIMSSTLSNAPVAATSSNNLQQGNTRPSQNFNNWPSYPLGRSNIANWPGPMSDQEFIAFMNQMTPNIFGGGNQQFTPQPVYTGQQQGGQVNQQANAGQNDGTSQQGQQ